MKKVAFVLAICLGLFGLTVPAAAAYRDPICDALPEGSEEYILAGCVGSDDPQDTVGSTVVAAINTIIYIIGALAVFMIIFGGVRYAISQGDPSKIKLAKDTIQYSVIGLIVTLLAFAIVNFILAGFINDNENGGGGEGDSSLVEGEE